MFCHIINRFITRTRNIVHFGVTLNMLFTYLHTVFCVYMYIQLYTIIHTHTTYIHAYIQTYTYTYILIHAYTYIPTYMYIILARILIYVCIHYIPLVLTCKHKYIYTHTYMHVHTCIQLYIHELSMSYACIKYTYIAYKLYIYAFWLSSVYPSWSRFRGLWSSFLSP